MEYLFLDGARSSAPNVVNQFLRFATTCLVDKSFRSNRMSASYISIGLLLGNHLEADHQGTYPNNFRMFNFRDTETMLNRSSLLEMWMQQHSVCTFPCKDQISLMKFWQEDMTRDSYVRFLSYNRTIWTFGPCCSDPARRSTTRVGIDYCPIHWGT